MQIDDDTIDALAEVVARAEDVNFILGHFGGIYHEDTPIGWLARTAMERCMQNVGAAVRDGIPKGHPFRALRPEIPWQSVAGLRNVMAYSYGTVSHQRLWNIAISELPDLVEVAKEGIASQAESQ